MLGKDGAEATNTPSKDEFASQDKELKVPMTAKKQTGKGLQLVSQNESATKKKLPFDYSEQDKDNKDKLFNLKDLDP